MTKRDRKKLLEIHAKILSDWSYVAGSAFAIMRSIERIEKNINRLSEMVDIAGLVEDQLRQEEKQRRSTRD